MSAHKPLSEPVKFGIGAALALSVVGMLWGLKNRTASPRVQGEGGCKLCSKVRQPWPFA